MTSARGDQPRGVRFAPRPVRRWTAPLPALLAALVLTLLWLLPPVRPLEAAPVEWIEVAPTADGRQWWDAGSLRLNRADHLTVLSRFQPAAEATDQGSGGLYVMELDCGQNLYRDTSINGIPRWGAEWQPAGDDDLTAEVIRAACAAGADLNASARP